MFQKEERRGGDEEEYEAGYGQHQRLKSELDGKDWCQRSPCGAKPLRDDSEVCLHAYSKIMKPCICLMCHQPAEGKTQQQTLRDKLGRDLSHRSLMIWKLPREEALCCYFSSVTAGGADVSSRIYTPRV